MTERWRDVAGPVGVLDPGVRNAITDVPGVRVGHSQAESGQRTGVTVIGPPALPAPAGVAVVNGTGVLNAYLEIDEVGFMRTPVYLCGTHAVGTVIQAAITESGHGPQDVVLPVVGECDDGDLADSRTTTAGDVSRALGALGPEVAEGSIGAGTGMILFDFPGGIGTASRKVGGHHVGVLLLCNFGDRERLDLMGPRSRRPGSPRARMARALGFAPPTLRSAPSSCAGWRCGHCWASPAPARMAARGRARSGLRSTPGSRATFPTRT